MKTRSEFQVCTCSVFTLSYLDFGRRRETIRGLDSPSAPAASSRNYFNFASEAEKLFTHAHLVCTSW